MGPEHFVADKR